MLNSLIQARDHFHSSSVNSLPFINICLITRGPDPYAMGHIQPISSAPIPERGTGGSHQHVELDYMDVTTLRLPKTASGLN